MRRNTRLFFLEPDNQQADELLQNDHEIQNNNQESFQYPFNELSHLSSFSLNYLSQLSTASSVRIESTLESENNKIIIREFDEICEKDSNDDEKLNYIKNLSIHSTNILADVIIKKLNAPHYSGIRKLDSVTIMELLILAKKYPELSDFTHEIGLPSNVVQKKLPTIGVAWVDLRLVDAILISKLSNLRFRYGINDKSCLNIPMRSFMRSGKYKFDIEKNFNELYEAFTLNISITDIARQFCIREQVLINNYNKILESLRNKFPSIRSIESNLSHLSLSKKIQYLCKLTKNDAKEETLLQENDTLVLEKNNDESLTEYDEILEELELLFDENDDQLFVEIDKRTHDGSQIIYTADDAFNNAAAHIAANYEQSLQNDIAIGINEDFLERLLSICEAEETVTTYTYPTSSELGLFADNTITLSSREVASDVSSQAKALPKITK